MAAQHSWGEVAPAFQMGGVSEFVQAAPPAALEARPASPVACPSSPRAPPRSA
jgi:hypothetical protein